MKNEAYIPSKLGSVFIKNISLIMYHGDELNQHKHNLIEPYNPRYYPPRTPEKQTPHNITQLHNTLTN